MSIITQDMNILGNIISEGNVDFDGTLDGNLRCHTLTLRAHGNVKGEVVADAVFVYGKVKGLIRAKTVHLYTGSMVEGIIMHESITIEDGAVIDGKFKRTDRASVEEESASEADDQSGGGVKMLENIRLIR